MQLSPTKYERGPGLCLCIAIGMVAYGLGMALPQLGSATSAILLGLLITNLLKPTAVFHPGIVFSEKKILEWAVVGLGFGISVGPLQALGWLPIMVIGVATLSALLAAFLLAPFVPLGRPLVMLIGVGTAVCGASAIAAAAPLIAREKQHAGMAVGVVGLLGILGIFGLPVLAQVLQLAPEQSAFLVGGSLQAVGHVVAAGFSLGDETGTLAVAIKMGRVALLIPLLFFLAFRTSKEETQGKKTKLPWYLVLFLLAALLSATESLPMPAIDVLKIIAKGLLLVAMAALGLKIDISAFKKQASIALVVGGLVWLVQILGVTALLHVQQVPQNLTVALSGASSATF